jgi:hypothetical protein
MIALSSWFDLLQLAEHLFRLFGQLVAGGHGFSKRLLRQAPTFPLIR